jgi:hypothetical protein
VGTNYEQAVQAAFLVALLTGGPAPCVPGGRVERLDFQTTKLGYETDDLLVLVQTPTGQAHRLLLQIKYNLTLSSRDKLFEEVLTAFWHDYGQADRFNPAHDRLVIVKSHLTGAEHNHVKMLLNWARHHADSTGFLREVERVQAKAERLDIFRTVLARISGAAVADEELWRFLRCVELLDYDFQSTGSVDEANLLQLIELTKADGAVSTALDIWYEAKEEADRWNSNGGSITPTSLAERPLYRRFAPTRRDTLARLLARLARDSQAVTGLFRHTVAGVHLSRPAARQQVQEAVEQQAVVLVTGEAGVGKSALTWDVLAGRFDPSACFVFRADQFNVPHLRQVFDPLGSLDSLADLLAALALLPEKVLLVDSAEKLLEDAPDGAFGQLLAQLPTVGRCQLVLTARQYAAELLVQRYNLPSDGRVIVPGLEVSELLPISAAVPALAPLLANTQLRPLLRSLKYLELSVTLLSRAAADYSALAPAEFKRQLWRYVVEDATRTGDGLPQRRNDAFLVVALRRARQMTLFVRVDSPDHAALEALTYDGLLSRDGDEWRYAPTHDVLEDLALVRYIGEQWRESTAATSFFPAIGSEPALRRGFRLWVEEGLLAGADELLELLAQALASPAIESYWLDELLVAGLRSARAQVLFEQFAPELLANEARLLARCLHLLRTACRQPDPTGREPAFLLFPVGSGWAAALEFLARQYALPLLIQHLVAGLLLDWEAVLPGGVPTLPLEALAASTLVWRLLAEMEQGSTMWLAEGAKRERERLLTLALRLAEVAQPALTALIERALAVERTDSTIHYRIRQFYDQVREACLSGTATAALGYYLPQLVVRVANHAWKARPKPIDPYRYTSPLDREEEEFGIAHQVDDYPPGIYQTPIWLLLRSQPATGLQFVVDFVNYCIDYYRARHPDAESVSFTIADGVVVQQWGNAGFWPAYRGHSVLPHVVESVLMSAEKLLLELAVQPAEAGFESLRQHFRFVLVNSRCVALSAVLVSVTMAYPKAVGDEWLPLLTVPEFVEWDVHRAQEEWHYTSEFFTDDQRLVQLERRASNQLPHRTRYDRGLLSFVVDYQFTQGPLTPQIHAILDEYRASLTEQTEFFWRKCLSELDAREWGPASYDPEQGRVWLQPRYDEKVQAEQAAAAPRLAEWGQAAHGRLWIGNLLEGKPEALADWEKWEPLYAAYTLSGRRTDLDGRPAGLALLGLRHFFEQLTTAQLAWCQQTLCAALDYCITYAHDSLAEESNHELNNPFDQQFVVQSFVLLFRLAPDEGQRTALRHLLLRALTTHFSQRVANLLLHHCRTELFSQFPELLAVCWGALVAYAHACHEPEHPPGYSLTQQQEWEAQRQHRQQASQALLRELAAEPARTVVTAQLSWDTHVPHHLLTALHLLPPTTTIPAYLAYMQHLIRLTVNDLQREKSRNYGAARPQPMQQLRYDDYQAMQNYLPHFLLHAEQANTLAALEVLLNGLDQLPPQEHGPGEDIYRFVQRVLHRTILELTAMPDGPPDQLSAAETQLTRRFWQLWEYLLARLRTPATLRLAPEALLDIGWLPGRTDWVPLAFSHGYYRRAMQQLGPVQLRSVLHVLATAGDRTLLPGALATVVALAKAHPAQRLALYTDQAVAFSQRLFHRHLRAIKAQPGLVADFIWLLSSMADAGLSAAYLLREDVITFRT